MDANRQFFKNFEKLPDIGYLAKYLDEERTESADCVLGWGLEVECGVEGYKTLLDNFSACLDIALEGKMKSFNYSNQSLKL